MIRPKPGDTVLHRPSGETWVVAFADPAANQLMACGWPPEVERLSDCDVTEECPLAETKVLVLHIVNSGGYRLSRVRQLYPELFDGAATEVSS